MKRLFLFLTFAFACSLIIAQTPFQFNFQAVARDLAGNPMVNEDVDFRLSILQGSEAGAAIFVEGQSVQTNNFGLANLLVGTGTPEMGALDAIDWALGPFFLQIELDINDGQGMQLMGVSPMTSVPYALHALTSEEPGPEGPQGEVGPQGEPGLPGLDGLDAVMDSSYVDSLVQAYVSTNGIGGGCDINFPEGYSGDGITVKLFTPYTVPENKRLYITQVFSWQSTLEIDGNLISYGGNLPNSTGRSFTLGNTIVVNAGQIVSASSSNTRISGLLVTPSDALEGVTLSVGVDPGSQFTVPEGKKLYITSVQSYSSTLKIDGISIVSMSNYSNSASDPFSLNNPIVVNSGQVLAALANQPEDTVVVNGYMVDEDYFAGCGGSPSGTASILDSAMVADMIAAVGSSLPVGVIQAYAGESTPTDWLFCDGSAVNRTTYAELFSAIGESYGVGDGSTTFNLPDLRGRMPVGKDDMGGVPAGVISNNGDVLGDFGGEETHTLTVDEMPYHDHQVEYYRNGSSGSTGAANWNGITGDYVTEGPPEWETNGNVRAKGVGGDQPHNNMQPYLITNYIIKVSEGNESSEGQQGEVGPQGEPGEQGPQGEEGPQGPQGEPGDTGPAGVGIFTTINNGNGTFTIVYTDGSSFITSDLTGPPGPAGSDGLDGSTGATGQQGPTGVSISGTEIIGDSLYVELDNGQVLNAGYLSGGSSGSSSTINGNPAQSFEVPDFLYYTGDCSNGDLDVTAIETIANTTTPFNYCSLNISNSGTLDLGGPTVNARTFVLLVQDTLRIEGLLTGFNSSTGTGNAGVNTPSAGGPGGGASAAGISNTGESHRIQWNSIGLIGGANIIPPNYDVSLAAGVGSTCGGNGANVTSDQLKNAIKVRLNLEGGRGGTAGIGSGCSINLPWQCSTVPAGCGGDGLYIVCDVLDFSGTIDLRGSPTYNQAGGGGGGSLVISAREVIQNTGTVLLEGGQGSSASCGNGGTGAFLLIDR